MSLPARHGNPWSEDEIQKLLQAVKRKETHVQIAVAHQRTQGSIRAKLRGLAADYYFNDNRPIEDIMRFTGLDSETITDAISKRQWRMDQKVKEQTQVLEDPEPKREGMISLLSEIRDMMKEMLEIMKKN